jgi:gamma-glutamyltranspeptidase/glutathione hydrolase
MRYAVGTGGASLHTDPNARYCTLAYQAVVAKAFVQPGRRYTVAINLSLDSGTPGTGQDPTAAWNQDGSLELVLADDRGTVTRCTTPGTDLFVWKGPQDSIDYLTRYGVRYSGKDAEHLGLGQRFAPHQQHGFIPFGLDSAALEMLNILEVCAPVHGLVLADLGPTHPDYWHFMVEAKKLAYSDLQAYNADPEFEDVPVDRLLSKSYAATLCDRIDMKHASEPSVTGGLDGGTIYLTAADRWGNMVSLIHSVFSVYGSRATVAPYGFVLHNRGSAFSLDPSHPNIVAPHKRPFHSIIAGFVMQDGNPLMTFGNMGGSVQPETHAQHMVNVIDHGMNIQMTTDAARFTHNQNGNTLSLEQNLYDLVGPALEVLGHEVRAANGGAVGGYQGILFTRDPTLPLPTYSPESIARDLPVNGVYRAGSDHRKDGQAAGW